MDGDFLFVRREHGARMKHLRSEERKFECLVKRQNLYPARGLHNSRVGSQDTVDIGPYLDVIHSQCAPDDSSRVIRAFPPHCRADPLPRHADEPLRHGNDSLCNKRLHLCPESVLNHIHQRQGSVMICIGDHELSCVDPTGIHPLFCQDGCHEPG